MYNIRFFELARARTMQPPCKGCGITKKKGRHTEGVGHLATDVLEGLSLHAFYIFLDFDS